MDCHRVLNWLLTARLACTIIGLAFLVLGILSMLNPSYRLVEDMWFYMTTLCFAVFLLLAVIAAALFVVSVILSAFFCQCGWMKDKPPIPSY